MPLLSLLRRAGRRRQRPAERCPQPVGCATSLPAGRLAGWRAGGRADVRSVGRVDIDAADCSPYCVRLSAQKTRARAAGIPTAQAGRPAETADEAETSQPAKTGGAGKHASAASQRDAEPRRRTVKQLAGGMQSAGMKVSRPEAAATVVPTSVSLAGRPSKLPVAQIELAC